jgi:predicted nucleotidyltransferase
MPSVFTTFASSRFVDQEAVLEALRRCAERLKAQHAEIVAVYLFGSFANRTATPRSDADLAVVVDVAREDRQRVWDAAMDIFLDAPVPVDLFVISPAQVAEGPRAGRGVARAVAREGVLLA